MNGRNHTGQLKNTLDQGVVLFRVAESLTGVTNTLVLGIVEAVAVAVVLFIEAVDTLAADLDHTHVPAILENVTGISIAHILEAQCQQEDVMLVTETILLLLDV